jgi:hypothetical protein
VWAEYAYLPHPDLAAIHHQDADLVGDSKDYVPGRLPGDLKPQDRLEDRGIEVVVELVLTYRSTVAWSSAMFMPPYWSWFS